MVRDRIEMAHMEALASFLAVKCFARDVKGVTILLRMDNITAVTYVNKLGGTVSHQMNHIVKELWLWCMNRDITLVAEHLPGVLNAIADEESRVMKDHGCYIPGKKWTCSHHACQRQQNPLIGGFQCSYLGQICGFEWSKGVHALHDAVA